MTPTILSADIGTYLELFVRGLFHSSLIVVTLGVSVIFWVGMGVARHLSRVDEQARRQVCPWSVSDVALLIPGHNEQLTIARTIQSALVVVPAHQVYVVSDGSSDDTVAIAESFGVQVLDLQPNRGKAGALDAAIQHFDLCDRYEFVLLVDADTELVPDYLDHALPAMSDPSFVALAGHAKSSWNPERLDWIGRLLVVHRERVYVMSQMFQKYGQTSGRLNVTPIVPGFASMYRTSALRQIDIAAPDLVIEDFNMTFEVHHRGLGNVAFVPGAAAYTQDPDNLADYSKQVHRWSLGLWQTVQRHGFAGGRFSLWLFVSVVETLAGSLLVLALWGLLALRLAAAVIGLTLGVELTGVGAAGSMILPTDRLLTLVILPEVLVACFVAVVRGRWSYLPHAMLSFLVRPIDAWQTMRALGTSFRAKRSSGQWVSPTRRV